MTRDEALERLRRQVIAQADAAGDNGWTDIPVPPEVSPDLTLRVPRGALEQWAVHLNQGSHLAAPWEQVSPVGVKQGADDPYHTDWMLGAGLDPLAMSEKGPNPHWQALSDAAYAARGRIQERLLGFTCTVLLPGPDIAEGCVIRPVKPEQVDWGAANGMPPVLVLPNASPDWLADTLRALDHGGAVIVERGGTMAHMIVEARTHGRGPVIRVPDARKLYPEGCILSISASSGTVRLAEQPRTFDPATMVGMWMPDPDTEEPSAVEAPPAWTLPAPTRDFGLSICPAGQSRPYDHYREMIVSCAVDGRDYHARASLHVNNGGYLMPWQRQPGSRGDIRGMLVIHVFDRHHRQRAITVASAERDWTAQELRAATHEALYMVAPSEHWDSPETAAARETLARQEHNWWLRSYGGLDNDTLLARARADITERRELVAECGDDFENATSEYFDALSSYRHLFRHYDIEFKARGMGTTMLTLEAMEEAEPSAVTAGP